MIFVLTKQYRYQNANSVCNLCNYRKNITNIKIQNSYLAQQLVSIVRPCFIQLTFDQFSHNPCKRFNHRTRFATGPDHTMPSRATVAVHNCSLLPAESSLILNGTGLHSWTKEFLLLAPIFCLYFDYILTIYDFF